MRAAGCDNVVMDNVIINYAASLMADVDSGVAQSMLVWCGY